ncbi:MAG: PEP-CTERM sorting domain-containing protein [Opitutaceae bacterium]|jgi:hypothetical protein|nr:PEP-CTERM sorting domain-containing protein [Opitutaceae bacterium]
MKTTRHLSLRNLLQVAASLALLPAGLAAQSVFIDFNSPSAISDNLNEGTQVTANTTTGALESRAMGDLTYSSGTGLAGSGGGQPPAPYADIFGWATRTAFTGDFSTATLSTYIKIKDCVLSGGGLALVMGFGTLAIPEFGNGNVNTTGAGTVNTGTVAIPRPDPMGGGKQYSLAIMLRPGATGTSDGIPETWGFGSYNNAEGQTLGSVTEAPLALDKWYFWETTIIHNAADASYTCTAKLYSSDDNGNVDTSAALLTYEKTVTNTGLSGAENIYGFISSQNGDRRGIAQIDNVSFSASAAAVPEPATLAALLGALALASGLFLRRHRRRR